MYSLTAFIHGVYLSRHPSYTSGSRILGALPSVTARISTPPYVPYFLILVPAFLTYLCGRVLYAL
jgi:hypothetical protein